MFVYAAIAASYIRSYFEQIRSFCVKYLNRMTVKSITLSLALAATVLGCGNENDSAPAPQAEAQSANVTAVTPAASAVIAPPPSAPVVPPPNADGTVPAVASTPQRSGPIVPGSAEDPNVMPAGFVPKPPALQYVVNGEPNLDALSQALQVYCMWKQSVPNNLEDLVTSKFLPELPALPAGKKYTINSATLSVGIAN